MFARLTFAFRHRTLRRRVASGNALLVYHRGDTIRVPVRCPHQGAPMIEGRIEGDCIVCPWHGCRISLAGEPPAPMKE